MRTREMPPGDIDYALIDPPLRALVRALNRSAWVRTRGCCAGRAAHPGGDFYLALEVRGMEGIRGLLRWLALSRSLGWDMCLEAGALRALVLPDVELCPAAASDGEWVRLELRDILGDRPPTETETRGAIRALEAGWNALHGQTGQHRNALTITDFPIKEVLRTP
ncbi:MAG: hypothetical protein P8Y39_01200 [Nitrospirota bacterium]|jgi:hypothetical protein